MSRITLLGPFCARLDYIFTEEDRQNARALLFNPSKTRPSIFWLMRCPNCNSPSVSAEPLEVTLEAILDNITGVVETLEQMFEGFGTIDESGDDLEADAACAIGLSPIELGYDQLSRQFWHPIEWGNIKIAVETALGLTFAKVEAVTLTEQPMEFGGNGVVSLYGQLYHSQPYYFLGQAGYWSKLDLGLKQGATK